MANIYYKSNGAWTQIQASDIDMTVINTTAVQKVPIIIILSAY